MITKNQLRKEILAETFDLLKDEGLSYETIAESREGLATLTDADISDHFDHPDIKTLEDARNSIDVLEELLKYIEAFPCA